MDPLKVQQPQETKLHFLDYWRIIRIRKTVILAVFLLVVITATVVTFILPETFASEARIKVQRDQSDIAELRQDQPFVAQYDPYFMRTEFEVIQSELILTNVVQSLNLAARWSEGRGGGLKTGEATEMLRRAMALRQVPNTSLIEIKVYQSKPEDAAEIANKIAEVYQAHRTQERTALSQGGIDALKRQVEEENEVVRKAQEKVDKLRVDLKIPDAIAQENMPTMLMTAETLRKLEASRIESGYEYVRMKTLLDRLQQIKPDELAQAIPTTGIQDTQLTSLMDQLNLAEQRQIALEKEYGPENSEVLKVSGMAEDLRVKVSKRLKGILDGLEVRVASLKQGLDDMQAQVDRATQLDIDKAAETRPYWEAKREWQEKRAFREALTQRLAMEETDVKLPKTSMVKIIDYAAPALKAARPNKGLNIALGVIIGLVVGIGLAFFIEYLDTSVKTIDDVERALGSPVLGVIPQNVGVLLDEGAESPHAEAYRVLRTNILFSRKDDQLNSVAVVSAGAGEGKSTTVFNLASVFAQSGQRIILVDSDLRRPTLHKMLKVSNHIGLTNYLLKQNTLEEVIQTTSLPTLDFLPSGKLPSSSLGILSSAQMKELITELKQHYDFVFFDSPPVMGVSDASILASEVDMTIQVIQYRRYPQPMNIRAKQLIEKVGGNLVGIVLNNINMSQDESYYYYSGYYHEYYSRNDDQEPEAAGKGPGQKA